MKYYLPAHKLYLLSGLSASGKSTMVKNLVASIGPEVIVSRDELRTRILGVSKELDQFGLRHHINGWTYHNSEVVEIERKIIEIRLKQGLPTILDATNLTDSDRGEYVKLAAKYGVQTEVLIVDCDLDTCKQRMSQRLARFDSYGLDNQDKKFQKTSRFDHKIIKNNDEIIFTPPLLNTTKVDIVGDVHGLLPELLSLLSRAGWKYENNQLSHSDPERKLLFMGDVVDRGPQSLEVLDMVMKAVKAQKAHFILGNHENNLLKAFSHKEEKGPMGTASTSSSETIAKVLELPEEKQKEIIQFLRSSPSFLVYWADKYGNLVKESEKAATKIAFVHADINYFHPFTSLKVDLVHGKSKLHSPVDTDSAYDAAFGQINDHFLIRGHIPLTNSQVSNVISLDSKQAFSGEMCLLQFDKFLESYIPGQKPNPAIIKEKCNFNYDNYLATSKKLLTDLTSLSSKKLVVSKFNEERTLSIHKYSRKVFFDNLWDKNKALFKARGLVIDLGGNIVQHPFDKIFNYKENNAGADLSMDQIVIAVEKINGFLGCITKHPHKNDLLLTTTGSFDSDFVGYINDFVTPELKATLLAHFANNNQTLMFEVIHPKDPHIIEYTPDEHGFYLIGARGKREDDKILIESDLDNLANKLSLRRPRWDKVPFSAVLDRLKNEKIEGYMVRKDSPEQETILKGKTNYYLVTKFIGRMNEGNIKLMYNNNNKFKEKIEEEFYPLVDYLTKNYSLSTFVNMDKENRIKTVRQSIELLNTGATIGSRPQP